MNRHRTIMKDFSFIIDKARVFHAIDCKEDSPVYQEVNRIYEEMLEIIDNIITPMILFEFHDNIKAVGLEELKDSNVLIYNFVTLGEDISKKSEELFTEGNYLEALILDTMTNELLFYMTEKAYKTICSKAKELGLSLKDRISPGDEEIPFHYQKHIWEKLNLEGLEIQINESYTFEPLKSIGLIYTTTDWEEKNQILHQCETCKNFQCKMRRK